MARPWPSIARTVFGDHQRYLDVYMRPYPGYYFTGDGATRDEDGYLWITGRVDDVINVSGHRLGTAEIESALVACECCAEAAIVAIPHDVKGQGIFAYCTLKNGFDGDEWIEKLMEAVKTEIGSFAKPDAIVITTALPKTRSGKLMRRLLRKIASRQTSEEELGDISTLADKSVVPALVEACTKVLDAKGL
eukprot:TRINITY_DN3501_c0_g1_i1.p2 TRINITY_DN3501_c0_g1~~TRINITY_DN3501_c0_g1_i1.p2  ORF type:complete len:191 (-),score=69.25 TRINITY_DN3501_c0_g1_i1:23-595(-)